MRRLRRCTAAHRGRRGSRPGEVAVVGGDQRHAGRRPGDQAGLDRALRSPARAAAVRCRCDRRMPRRAAPAAFSASRRGPRRTAVRSARRCRRSAGSAPRRARRTCRTGPAASGRAQCPGTRARTAAEVGQPGRVLRQQYDRAGARRGLSARASASWQPMIGCTPLVAQAGELQRAEQVGGVGDRDGRHAALARQRGELVGLDGSLAERIGRLGAEVDEIGMRTVSVAGSRAANQLPVWRVAPPSTPL